MHTKTYKIGKCKGNARIWIEGNELLNAGFLPSTKYTLEYKETSINPRIILRSDFIAEGLKIKKVSSCAGGSRPIIDLNNKKVTKYLDENFDGANSVKVTFNAEGTKGIIVIQPNI